MVEQDFSRINMDRYRSQRALAVGGPYGRRQRIQPFDPVLQVVNFDDGVFIDRFDADTNFYSTSAGLFPLPIVFEFDTSAVTVHKEAFLKLTNPTDNIAAVVVELINMFLSFSVGFDTDFSGGAESIDSFNILKGLTIGVPLDIGDPPDNPFALDKLTWNNSNAFFGGNALQTDPDGPVKGFESPSHRIFATGAADGAEEIVALTAKTTQTSLFHAGTTGTLSPKTIFGVQIFWGSIVINPQIGDDVVDALASISRVFAGDIRPQFSNPDNLIFNGGFAASSLILPT